MKIFLKHSAIIVFCTIIATFLTNKFNWFGIDFTATLIFKVLTAFGLTCVFMQLFKNKIKSIYIFLFLILGIILGLLLVYFPDINFKFYVRVFLFMLITVLFGWGASVAKNRFIRVSFWFIGIYYMQIFIMNEPDLQIIDWLMYIPAFILGIWACKKYGYEKKLLLLPLLLFVLNFIFEFSVIFLLDGFSAFDDAFAKYAITFQILTFLSLCFAYCCGFWFVKTEKLFVKILLPVIVVLLALFMLKSQIRTLIHQKFENNTWTGETLKPAKLSELEFFTDSTLNKVTIQDLQKDIYVLDFYSKNCGVCFMQMPKFQQLAEKYKENTEIGFYAVNVFSDTTDIAQLQKFLEKKNIKIPLLFISAKDEKYLQNFAYDSFPQYNIVKNDTIIFDGYLEILDFFERKYLK